MNEIIMSRQDQLIKIIIVLIISIHIAVWAGGLFSKKLPFFISWLNMSIASCIWIYWFKKQWVAQHHTIEPVETLILSFEVLVIAVSAFSMMSRNYDGMAKAFQYLVFSFHFISLVAMFLFMLFFKINRLF